MTALGTFTFATLLGDRRLGGAWRDALTTGLAAYGVGLAGEELSVDGELLGFFAFHDLTELAASPLDSWTSRGERPWAGKPAGVFSWTHTISTSRALDRLVPAMIQLGRGPFARLQPAGEAQLESLALRQFPLSDLLERRGFEDGGPLLRDDEYLEDARRRAEASISAAGLDAVVGTWPEHNLLRIAGPVLKNGIAVDDASAILADRSLDLWCYDWRILRHPTFWWE